MPQAIPVDLLGRRPDLLADPFRFLQKSLTNAHHAILDYTAQHHLKDTPRTAFTACRSARVSHSRSFGPNP